MDDYWHGYTNGTRLFLTFVFRTRQSIRLRVIPTAVGNEQAGFAHQRSRRYEKFFMYEPGSAIGPPNDRRNSVIRIDSNLVCLADFTLTWEPTTQESSHAFTEYGSTTSLHRKRNGRGSVRSLESTATGSSTHEYTSTHSPLPTMLTSKLQQLAAGAAVAASGSSM